MFGDQLNQNILEGLVARFKGRLHGCRVKDADLGLISSSMKNPPEQNMKTWFLHDHSHKVESVSSSKILKLDLDE